MSWVCVPKNGSIRKAAAHEVAATQVAVCPRTVDPVRGPFGGGGLSDAAHLLRQHGTVHPWWTDVSCDTVDGLRPEHPRLVLVCPELIPSRAKRCRLRAKHHAIHGGVEFDVLTALDLASNLVTEQVC